MWSWWHTLESLERVSSVIFVLVIIAAILTALGTIGTRMVGRQIDRLKAQRDAAEKAELRQQLAARTVISQPITQLEPGDAILLDEEPDPQSVLIHVGPLVHRPQEGYGYHIEGQQIVITNPQTLAQVAGRLPGGVTVEYRRRVKAQAK